MQVTRAAFQSRASVKEANPKSHTLATELSLSNPPQHRQLRESEDRPPQGPGALVGAFSGFVGYQIGTAFQGAQGAQGSFGHVAAHATLGGVTAELNGGKFGHGFVAAGFSTALDPTIDTGSAFGDGVVHAMVGGTSSVLSGGKFGNGAVTAAFAFGLNQLSHKTIKNNTKKIELLESTPQEDFDAFSDRAGQRLVDLTEKTGFEHTIGYAKRTAVGFPDNSQYAGVVQTQSSHIFSAVYLMPSGYQAMHNISGHVLRLHSHGLSSMNSRPIRANLMDRAYRPELGRGSRIAPNVPNQDRFNFSPDDAASRGGLAFPGGIKWWPGEGHD